MVQIIDDAGATQVFASAKIAGELASATDVPVEVVTGRGYAARLAADPAPVPTTDPAALAWLFYTSGTTGRSKGAMLSHRNLMAMTVSHLADFDDPDENCSLIHGAPMSHGSGLYIAPVRSAWGAPGDTGVGGIRTRRVPRSLRSPSGL